MADTCACPPAFNTTCSLRGTVMIYQPQCQIIPNGDRVFQSYYDAIENATYYTYGLINLCTSGASPVTELYIAISEFIPLVNILAVEQRLDNCPAYTPIAYDYENNTGFKPPNGTRYLRMLINGDLNIGSSGLYRVSVLGDSALEILESGANVVIRSTFVNGGFVNQLLLPGSPDGLRLTVLKNCEVNVTDNKASIDYSVIIGNPNERDITDVLYEDIINYDGTDVVVGMVTVVPDTISVDTSVAGRILLSGDLATIRSAQTVEIKYTVLIDTFRLPGSYTLNNLARVTTRLYEESAQCIATIGVVGLVTTNCCTVSISNDAIYRLAVTNNVRSPATHIIVRDLLTIPDNVMITFISFDVCSAIFVDDSQPVPLNVPITNRQVMFTCIGDIPMSDTVTYDIQFKINKTSNFTELPVSIINVIEDVVLDQEKQVLLAVVPLPNNNRIDVKGLIQCDV